MAGLEIIYDQSTPLVGIVELDFGVGADLDIIGVGVCDCVGAYCNMKAGCIFSCTSSSMTTHP